MKHCFLLFAFFYFWLVQAQEFKGQIVNTQGVGIPNVVIKEGKSNIVAISDSLGMFSFFIDFTQTTYIFGYVGETKIFGNQIDPNYEKYKSKIIKITQGDGGDFIPTVNININRIDNPFTTIIKPRELQINPSINGGVESLIKTLGGVSGNNELSSQYNVRGGSFDENLTYINDIEIYRPQLIQSGQQEGLSIINPDFVEYLSFSAGGFEAKYGDKMSSVLDVKYNKPDSAGAIINLGFMQNSASIYGGNKKWNYQTGVRHFSNNLVTKSLDEKGVYTMNFADWQTLIGYKFNVKNELNLYANVSLNRYALSPTTRSTDFGTFFTPIRLQVQFDGSENMNYDFGIISLNHKYQYNKNTQFKFIAALTGSNEEENMDIQGAYELKLLEKNDNGNQGKPLRTLGFGYYIDHGRNRFQSQSLQLAHLGNIIHKRNNWDYGLRYFNIKVTDKIDEWLYNDSGDYNIPPFGPATDSIIFDDVVNARNGIQSHKFEAHIQNGHVFGKKQNVITKLGVRANYWSLNKELFFSPRFNISWEPNKGKTIKDTFQKWNYWILKAAIGAYYQPAFYRELRGIDGQINTNLKAQRSVHFLVGSDKVFKLWKRKFKWTTEAYYKHLTSLVPYYYDNIRIRYYATNSSNGYATGIDNRINGEFIKGLESWITLSLLQSKERIRYTDAGVLKTSDWLRRPSDKRVNLAIIFQDELLNDPNTRVNLSFNLGSSLPYFLNKQFRYTTKPFTLSPYRRVDMGFSKVLIGPKTKYVPKGVLKHVKQAWISLDIFNLANFKNTISYQWVKDLNNNIFGVPEYLTGRRLNLRLHLEL